MSGLVPVSTVGSKHRAVAMAAAKQARPAANRILHPVGGADRVAFADQRADVGGLVERIAQFQFANALEQQFREFAIDRLLDQDALDRDAGLPGVAETSGYAALGGVSEIGVAMHDHGSVAPEFENDFFLARVLLHLPTDGGAAR